MVDFERISSSQIQRYASSRYLLVDFDVRFEPDFFRCRINCIVRHGAACAIYIQHIRYTFFLQPRRNQLNHKPAHTKQDPYQQQDRPPLPGTTYRYTCFHHDKSSPTQLREFELILLAWLS